MGLKGHHTESMTIIEASREAAALIHDNRDLHGLYSKAIRLHGEGELHRIMLERIVNALESGKLADEVFASGRHLFSFCCGLWIQYLLTEIGEVDKRSLREVVIKINGGPAGESRH